RAALAHLVQEAVGDELEALLDQLVVDLALLLDLFRGLELGGEPGLELAEPHVVQPCGVDVIAGDAPSRATTQLDGAVHRPVRVLRVVYGDEDLRIHRHARDRLVLVSCRRGQTSIAAAATTVNVARRPPRVPRRTYSGKERRAGPPRRCFPAPAC